MQINKLLTTYNYDKGNDRKIEWLVVHYVGALGGAKANCEYYASKYIGASAHYFVGHEGEIFQSVEDKDVAWHCGAKSYVHSDCRNYNSIGVEMCVRKDANGNWYFEPKTVASTIDLVKMLMAKYNIPVERVLRHFDITGKICPQPYVADEQAWKAFKAQLVGKEPTKESAKASTSALVKEWQKAAIADGFKFPKYGADGKWGSECESVASKAIVKKRVTYKYKNLTKIVQKAVGASIDGKCGTKTDAAIRAYQKAHGLTVDGCVGLNTWRSILGIK